MFIKSKLPASRLVVLFKCIFGTPTTLGDSIKTQNNTLFSANRFSYVQVNCQNVF